MQQKNSKSLAILAFASLLSSTTQAQQNTSVAPQGMLIQGPGAQRIFEDRGFNGIVDQAYHSAEPVSFKTVTLQVPGFKPGDQDTHVHFTSRLSDDRSGGGFAKVDEYGIAHLEQAINPGTQQEEMQYYLTSVGINTREARMSLDLHDVKLWPFLNSLQRALFMANRQATNAGLTIPQRIPRVNGDRQKYADKRLNIQGENLTIERAGPALPEHRVFCRSGASGADDCELLLTIKRKGCR
jgi:hypothetical protein